MAVYRDGRIYLQGGRMKHSRLGDRISGLRVGNWALAFALACSAGAEAQQLQFKLVAGVNEGEFGLGDGGPATGALLRPNVFVSVGSQSELYLIESGRHRARKVMPDGIISTIAGTIFLGGMDSGDGYSGDGGPATNARLNDPHGIAVDSAGNVFIADTANNRIRKVAPNGTITTIAGGSQPGFSGDGGPAVDAKLRFPCDVKVDGQGNVYVADTQNLRVRKITLDGKISTVAGNGRGGFSEDGGLASRADSGNIDAIALDSAGNLYFTDGYYRRVRMVSSAGIISTLVGRRTERETVDPKLPRVPGGLAVDAAGTLYFIDRELDRIWVRAPDGGLSYLTQDPKLFWGITSLALDAQGRLYVADHGRGGGGRVRMVTHGPETSPQGTAASSMAPEQVRLRALNAIAANEEKSKYLLYKTEHWGNYFSPGSVDKSQTPIERSHLDMLKENSRPSVIYDGWSDRPLTGPPEKRALNSGSLKDRIAQVLANQTNQPGEPQRIRIIQGLLSPTHKLTISGEETSEGTRAYVVESLPPQNSEAIDAAQRCADAIRATLFLDEESLFPVRTDLVVVRAQRCSPAGVFPLDDAGTREQHHYVKLVRKAPCAAEPLEVWAMDYGVQFDHIHVLEYRSGEPKFGVRVWTLEPVFMGGVFRNTTTRSDFRVFVSGSCLGFGKLVEAPLIESVSSKISFGIPADNFREPGQNVK
jgi:sugar lactone lactonase YvrE